MISPDDRNRKFIVRFPTTTCVLLIACGMTVRAEEPEGVQFVGSSSCATFGCHGNTVTRSPDAWKTSFILWTRNDPHAGAFQVLFNERSAQMVELLVPNLSDIREGEAPAEPQTARNTGSAGASPSRNMSNAEYEANYWSVIEQRCIGCHATPAVTDTTGPTSTIRPPTEALRHGVSCESCHGAAGKWLTEHATSRWADYTPEDKADRWGLTNTQDLTARAAVCVDCHVGPRQSPTGEVFDVTHELIAAGHPRLSFEFSAYLANLPPHWDEAKDKTRHGGASFHFDAWLVGQLQMARKLASQLELRSSPADRLTSHAAWPEFSNFDCFACHHRLSVHRLSTQHHATISSATRGQPQPTDWPFAQLQIIARSSTTESIRELEQPLADARKQLVFGVGESPASRQQSFAVLRNALAVSSQSMLHDRLVQEARVAVLENLLGEITSRQATSWDRVMQFQLALSAFVEDCDSGDSKRTGIARLTQQLATYLDSRFGLSRSASIYVSPEQFDSTDKELLTQLQAISVELKSMR